MSFPNLKGFSVRNLKYMKSFYNEYKDDEEFVQLVAQLPWKHNITLMQKVKDKEIRKWYMNRCLEDDQSDSILIYQIDTNSIEKDYLGRNKKLDKLINILNSLNSNIVISIDGDWRTGKTMFVKQLQLINQKGNLNALNEHSVKKV